jgi:hypothetical protein
MEVLKSSCKASVIVMKIMFCVFKHLELCRIAGLMPDVANTICCCRFNQLLRTSHCVQHKCLSVCSFITKSRSIEVVDLL